MCSDFFVNAGSDTTFCPDQSLNLVSPEDYTSDKWLPGGEKNVAPNGSSGWYIHTQCYE